MPPPTQTLLLWLPVAYHAHADTSCDLGERRQYPSFRTTLERVELTGQFAASQQGLHEESEASTAKLSRKKPAAQTSHTLAPAQLDCRSGQAVQLADPAFAALEPGQQGVQVTEPSESV